MKDIFLLCLLCIICSELSAQSEAGSLQTDDILPRAVTRETGMASPDSQIPPDKNFKGVYDFTNSHPPDTHGAVGQNDIVSISNLAMEILDKSGNIISGPTPDSAFFAPLKSYGIPKRDGRITYDPFSKRWIYILLYGPSAKSTPLGFFIAISTGADPTGSWNMWAIATTAIDYPTLGFNMNWICVGNNLSGKLYVFDKPFMYSHASAASPSYMTLSNIFGIWQPCVTLDSSESNLYLVKTENGKQGKLSLAKISGTNDDPDFVNLEDIQSGYSWSSPASLKYSQEGTYNKVTAGGKDGMMNAIFINHSLWCTQAVGFINPSRAGVQWWQINPEQSSVVQFGRFQDTTAVFDYVSPSIIVDYENNVLVSFSIFSRTCYISAGYIVHLASEKSGTNEKLYTFFSGLAVYSRGKWGDYSHSCIDPVDHSLWTVQAYADADSDWATRWANVNLDKELKTKPAQNSSEDDIHLYPNPSQNKLTVTLPNHDPAFSIDILNSDAEYVSELKVPANETEVEINTSDFPPGIYFLQFKFESGNRLIKFEVRR